MGKVIWCLLCCANLFHSCTHEKVVSLSVPAHFPAMKYPAANQPTEARVALGKRLFFDRSLSLDSSVSCHTCHLPELAFTDGRSRSIGIHGRLGKRNAPSLLNAGYLDLLNKDGGVKKLDLQALVPIEDENEMGIPILSLSKRLKTHVEYQAMAKAAYDQEMNPAVISKSLASFVRTLISCDSPYDKYLRGDPPEMSESAQRGLTLFESKRLNCTACHSGFNLTNNAFENNGLYEDYADLGRALITLDSLDEGKFRVVSLRNISITAPYMHDGSLPTLDAVISHYERVGYQPRSHQSKKLGKFTLTGQERQDLIAFLKALTDAMFQQSGHQ